MPSISAMTAGSFGLRASKISVTRGRPPVMSCVPDASRGVLASSVPGGDHLAFVDFDVRPLGQVVEVEDLAVGVFDDDLRVQVALVLDDDEAHRCRWGPSRRASSRLRSRPRSGPCRPSSARIGMLCGSHSQSDLRRP